MTVLLQDLLDHLVAKTNVPSAIGSQLDSMRDHAAREDQEDEPEEGQTMAVKAQHGSPHDAADREEARMLALAPVLRCLDAFCRLEHSHVFRDGPALARLQREVKHRSLGEVAICCLRAYQERRTSSESRALVEVYELARSLAPRLFPAVDHQESTLAHAFGQDNVKVVSTARKKAAELYADSLLALSAWVGVYNRAQQKAARG